MCPICGLEDARDDSTGYHGAEICPGCEADGWIETADGSYVNEQQEEDVSEFDNVRRG